MSVLVKTGSDATTAAIRAARCFTKKNKILDVAIMVGMIGVLKYKEGIPKSTLQDILEFKYNDIGSVGKLLKKNKNEIAAIITTPISHSLGKKLKCQKKFFK